MSFSSDVKEELAKHISPARHCQIAEFAAILHFCGRIKRQNDGSNVLLLETENEAVLRKCFTLLRKTFNIEAVGSEGNDSILQITDCEDVWNIFKTTRLIGDDGTFHGFTEPVSPILIKNACCKRSFLRGVFLCAGSMSDPAKGYHLELVTGTEKQAGQIQQILWDFELDAKVIPRKKYFVVYLKEGSNIVDFLNICEAHVSLMNFENLRIVKEMRNSINRRVNCEAANITKTVNAAAKQIADITMLQKTYGFENLPENLREMAEVRLEHPDATLKELGQYLNPPVGKSGVNHRLRKLSEIAEEFKK
ncbi:MAG: DNA-binding protein WhiA [Lachnospiraceae bacterium]